jgi:hypothetical protein
VLLRRMVPSVYRGALGLATRANSAMDGPFREQLGAVRCARCGVIASRVQELSTWLARTRGQEGTLAAGTEPAVAGTMGVRVVFRRSVDLRADSRVHFRGIVVRAAVFEPDAATGALVLAQAATSSADAWHLVRRWCLDASEKGHGERLEHWRVSCSVCEITLADDAGHATLVLPHGLPTATLREDLSQQIVLHPSANHVEATFLLTEKREPTRLSPSARTAVQLMQAGPAQRRTGLAIVGRVAKVAFVHSDVSLSRECWDMGSAVWPASPALVLRMAAARTICSLCGGAIVDLDRRCECGGDTDTVFSDVVIFTEAAAAIRLSGELARELFGGLSPRAVLFGDAWTLFTRLCCCLLDVRNEPFVFHVRGEAGEYEAVRFDWGEATHE